MFPCCGGSSVCLPQFSWAAITKHYGLGCLKTEIYFSQFWRLQDQGQSLAIEFLLRALLLECRGPSPLWALMAFPLSVRRETASSLMSLLLRALISSDQGPTLMTSSKAKPKSSHPNTVTLEVRASTHEFQRAPHSVLCRQSCGMFSSIPSIYPLEMHSFSLKRWQRTLEGCSDSYDIPLPMNHSCWPSPVFATCSLEDKISPCWEPLRVDCSMCACSVVSDCPWPHGL